MRDDWNIAEEGSGASVEPCRLRLICPKGLLSSSAWSGIRGRMEEGGTWGQQQGGHSSAGKCRPLLPAVGAAPPKRPPHTSHSPRAAQGDMRAGGGPNAQRTPGTLRGPTQAGVTAAQRPRPTGHTIPTRSRWRQHRGLAEPTGQPQTPAPSTGMAGELWAWNLLFPGSFQQRCSRGLGHPAAAQSSVNPNPRGGRCLGRT